MTVHVLTDKDPRDAKNDKFFDGLTSNFFKPKVLTSLEGRTVFQLVNDYHSLTNPKRFMFEKDPASVLRAFEVRRIIGSGVGAYSSYSRELILVKKAGTITKQERLNPRKKGDFPDVLVNIPVVSSQVTVVYPRSRIFYYANDPDEAIELRKASGIEKAVVLLPNPFDLKNCLRLGYDNLRYIDFSGVLTEDLVDSQIAQANRRNLLLQKNEGGCIDCHFSRAYAYAQAQILGIKSQKELTGEFPKERLRVLFGNDLLIGKVEDIRELPILGKIGPICYHCHSPLVHEAFGKISPEKMCGGYDAHTLPSTTRFKDDYRALCEKYGVSYPTKK